MWKPKIARSLAGDTQDTLFLSGSRCSTCNRTFFPSRKNCPQCLTQDTVSDICLSRTGTLHSYVVCTMAPPGYTVPHAQGYIDLENGGGRIFALLVDYGEEADLEVGLAMELVTQPCGEDADGNQIIEYRFRPSRSKNGGKEK